MMMRATESGVQIMTSHDLTMMMGFNNKEEKEKKEMIKITKEMTLCQFEAWAGAKDRLEKIIEKDLVNEVEEMIAEIWPNGASETEINDFLWFDIDGYYNLFDCDEWASCLD